jgi:hypothetical protein
LTPDEQLDHTPLGKGKYATKTASEVAEIDPAYLEWAYRTWTPKPCSAVLARDCWVEMAESLRPRRRDEDHE